MNTPTAFEGFSEDDWVRLVQTLRPQRERNGTLFVIVDDAELPLSAFSSRGTALSLSDPVPDDLSELAGATGSDRCLVIDQRGLQSLFDDVAERLDPTADYPNQVVTVIDAVQRLSDRGQLRLWPSALAAMLSPTGWLERSFDSLVPDGHAALFALFEGGELFTGFAVSRHGGKFERVVGPQVLKDWTGPLGGDWTRDHRVLCDAVGLHLAPLHTGVFCERATFRRLWTDRRPGRWATAAAVRELIVHPMAPALRLSLGVEAVAGVLSGAARLFDVGLGIDPIAWLGAALKRRSEPPPEDD